MQVLRLINKSNKVAVSVVGKLVRASELDDVDIDCLRPNEREEERK